MLVDRAHSAGVVSRLARSGISGAPLVCRTKGLAFVDVLDLMAFLNKGTNVAPLVFFLG